MPIYKSHLSPALWARFSPHSLALSLHPRGRALVNLKRLSEEVQLFLPRCSGSLQLPVKKAAASPECPSSPCSKDGRSRSSFPI